MPGPNETCVMCGSPLEGKATYTAALIFGNKSRDPHVGPYCKDCGPPAIVRTIECVEDCPLVNEKWVPVNGNCIIKPPKQYPWESPKCEFSLGRSPIRHGDISCIHPARRKKKVQISEQKKEDEDVE